ncbi:unnamed protein product [Pylaiella littoralis]
MKTDLFTQDHYRVLGVARDANHGAIRKAYLKLVKQHHPDVSKGAQSEERFKAIASAWEVMGDKSKRALYDEKMADPGFRHRTEYRRRQQQGGGAPGGGGQQGARGGRRSYAPPRGHTPMPPILRAFEFFTHPRVIMVGVPLACVGYMVFGNQGSEEPSSSVKVDAWLNPSTQRWETPAPWDEEYRKRRQFVQKVDRSIVHEAEKRR